MKTLQEQLQEIRKQFEATPWLKWAAVAIVLLGMVFVWVTLEGARNNAQQQAIDAEAKLRRVRALQGQDTWLAREEETKQLLAALEAQMPLVDTPGLAQAALQSWLRTLTEMYTAEQGIRISIEKAAAVNGLDNVVKVRATLSGGLTPREALNLIRKIESSPSLTVIETLNITNDHNKTVTLSLNAYYRIAVPAEAP